MVRRLFILCILVLSAGASAVGQKRVVVAFWNVENLHDTIPSLFYDDRDFTPGGRHEWNTERYRAKLENLARVIDDLDPDVVGLAEVENETVVRDLILSLRDDYNYIHRTGSDRRGMDLALLYKGDKFWPGEVRLIPSAATREFLSVEGVLLGEQVNIIVCHLPSRANKRSYRAAALDSLASVARTLAADDPGRKLVIMGDFNAEQSEKAFRDALGRCNRSGLFDRSLLIAGVPDPRRGGFGSCAYGNRWSLVDHILLSLGFMQGEGLKYESGGVFVRQYMLSGSDSGVRTRTGYPLRTITSGVYTGGYSDHLPVYVILTL